MKIRGPFFSAGASGSIFGAITMFPWKGKTIARELVQPAQPRTAAQMNVRIKLLALGKVNKGFTDTATLEIAIRAKSPSGIPWNAAWIGYAIHEYIKDNDDYDTLWTEFSGLAGEVTTAWQTGADNLGLEEETLTVEGKSADHPATFSAAFAPYCLAKACWFMEVLDESEVKYTDPVGWDAAAVAAFCARTLD